MYIRRQVALMDSHPDMQANRLKAFSGSAGSHQQRHIRQFLRHTQEFIDNYGPSVETKGLRAQSLYL